MYVQGAQANYQLRLAWGSAGLTSLAEAGIVAVIDTCALPQLPNALALARRAAALPNQPTVFMVSLRNVTATATAIYQQQLERGERTAINFVLVGDDHPSSRHPATQTAIAAGGDAGAAAEEQIGGGFAVEDYLAAGALGEALSARGLDHSAPEVAVAVEGFRALRQAVGHLVSASASARALAEAGYRDLVKAAAALDAEPEPSRVNADAVT